VWYHHPSSGAHTTVCTASGIFHNVMDGVKFSNKLYTIYFIWKLLYMFRVVPPPIIRSAYNCMYTASGIFHIIMDRVKFSNKLYRIYFIWKLLYMFRVVPPPIIRSAYNCMYSIWYFSKCNG